MAVSAAELVQQTAAPKRRGKQPVFEYLDNKSLADDCMQAMETAKDLAEHAGKKQAELRNELDSWYAQQVRDLGFRSSVLCVGLQGGLLVSYKDLYRVIKPDAEKEIRKIAGKRFADWFYKPTKLRIKKAIAADRAQLDAVIVELAKALGRDRFAAIFETEQALVPTTAFTEQRHRALSAAKNTELQTAGVVQSVGFSVRR